jgi:hypothetical protein
MDNLSAEENRKIRQSISFDTEIVIAKSVMSRMDVGADKRRILIEISQPRLVGKIGNHPDLGDTWICSYQVTGVSKKPVVETIFGTSSLNALGNVIGSVASFMDSLPFANKIMESVMPYFGLLPLLPIDHDAELGKMETAREKIANLTKEGQAAEERIKNAKTQKTPSS